MNEYMSSGTHVETEILALVCAPDNHHFQQAQGEFISYAKVTKNRRYAPTLVLFCTKCGTLRRFDPMQYPIIEP